MDESSATATATATGGQANTKEYLVQSIREWIRLEHELKQLKNKMVLLKAQQMVLSDNLIEAMKKQSLGSIKLKEQQSELVYKQSVRKQGLSKKFLMDVLAEYFNGSVEKASEVSRYIMDRREEIVQDKVLLKTPK